MYRSVLRSAARPAASGLRTTVRSAPRRLASTTSPADKPRSWKGSALRWGLAGTALYYYNTSPVFADEIASDADSTIRAPASFSEEDLPTVDSVLEEKRKQIKAKIPSPEKAPESAASNVSSQILQPESAEPAIGASSPEALEEEAGQQGAFNPETGEINWDCPCLGGMAHGPCGEEFKTAFSCFIYSEEEPKGMDCIDKFQGMQECFRKYPEIYGGELTDDDEEEGAAAAAPIESAQAVRVEDPVAAAVPDSKVEAPAPSTDAVPAQWNDATADNDKPEASPGEKQEEENKEKKLE
ncbi:hypothetical protein B0I35DRAFT_348099 [Stachybotrys elegans]|uniref:Mitochondrial intermembrane space import and assembly protein 40 n=1 Tax=Stachybotrys elegans TaxID=80388 RepID=A0A8K0SU39_9HYPO|nr:hypothetical protein B0I35DRAFT_348099 [Stachybotrys elegans]